MFAMLLTAVSYGRMARAYPSAGSAFTYVGQELHPALGYVTGWSMVMDYVLNPDHLHDLLQQGRDDLCCRACPTLSGWCFSRRLFTMLNLRGVKASARTNDGAGRRRCSSWWCCSSAPPSVICSALLLSPADLLRPFYDPATFSLPAVLTGASIACLTYIGFDGISTLSEEVENPRRNILLATVLTCLITGLLAFALGLRRAARVGRLDGISGR